MGLTNNEIITALLMTARHKAITAEIYQRAIFGAVNEKTRLQVEALIKRIRGKYIESEPLFWKRRYYRPTLRLTRRFGLPEECAEPLGAQALCKAYAYSYFCCMRSVPFIRLTRPRLQKLDPRHWEEFLSKSGAFYSDYCQAEVGYVPWISRMQVDLGGDYQRFLSTCRETLAECLEKEAIRGLLDDDCFRFTIITGEERKKESFQAALDERPLGVPTHIFVVPDLTDLIGQNLAGKEEPNVVHSNGGAI